MIVLTWKLFPPEQKDEVLTTPMDENAVFFVGFRQELGQEWEWGGRVTRLPGGPPPPFPAKQHISILT